MYLTVPQLACPEQRKMQTQSVADWNVLNVRVHYSDEGIPNLKLELIQDCSTIYEMINYAAFPSMGIYYTAIL